MGHLLEQGRLPGLIRYLFCEYLQGNSFTLDINLYGLQLPYM